MTSTIRTLPRSRGERGVVMRRVFARTGGPGSGDEDGNRAVGEHGAADTPEQECAGLTKAARAHDDEIVLACLDSLENGLGCRTAANDGRDGHVLGHERLGALDHLLRLALQIVLGRNWHEAGPRHTARGDGDADQRQPRAFGAGDINCLLQRSRGRLGSVDGHEDAVEHRCLLPSSLSRLLAALPPPCCSPASERRAPRRSDGQGSG